MGFEKEALLINSPTKSPSWWSTIAFEDLPEWAKDNDYIKRGYRPVLDTPRLLLGSVFRVHNETGNIWTHGLGCFAFLGLGIYTILAMASLAWLERFVVSLYFVGAVMCLGFSATFHTVLCHSDHVKERFARFDYLGITLLISGSTYPAIYYIFYCSREWKIVYMSIVTALAVLITIVTLWPKFAQPRYRPLRAVLYVSLGCFAAIPLVHEGIVNGFHYELLEIRMGFMGLLAFSYIFGAVLYGLRVPERFFPGTFDIVLHSHQIFHIFVLAGTSFFYVTVVNAYQYRIGNPCPVP